MKGQIGEKIKMLLEQVESRKYYISIGMEYTAPGCDIVRVIKTAEKKMYDAKRSYYRELGREVR